MDRFKNTVLLALTFGVSAFPAPVASLAQPAPSKPVPIRAAPFANIVWRVSKSRQVTPGQLYVFLSDGTLVITSGGGRPAFGSWTYKNGAFTMTEEGQRYKVFIRRLTASEFQIKILSPGEPVEMTLVPARGA